MSAIGYYKKSFLDTGQARARLKQEKVKRRRSPLLTRMGSVGHFCGLDNVLLLVYARHDCGRGLGIDSCCHRAALSDVTALLGEPQGLAVCAEPAP